MRYYLRYYSIVFTDGGNLDREISFSSSLQEDIRSYIIVQHVMTFHFFSPPDRMVTVLVIATKRDTPAHTWGDQMTTAVSTPQESYHPVMAM